MTEAQAEILAEAAWLDLSRKNPAWLGEYALGLKAEPFHLEWQDLCSAHNFLLLYAPTEFGKSSQLSVVRPIWELGRNPDVRIALISDTESKAKKWLSQIRVNIEINERLRKVFPHLMPEDRPGYTQVWSDEKINVRRSQQAAFTQKDYSIQAFGVGGPLGGSRFDIIILDDVLDFENTRTPGARAKNYEWFKSPSGPLSRIVDGGSIWDIGTAWHEDDYRHKVGDENPEFKVVVYQAGLGICVWPDRWSDERLRIKRILLGELEFARQFLNIAFGEATGYLPIAAIIQSQELCDDPPGWWIGELAKEDLRWCTAGVDVGATRTAGGSRAAITVLGLGLDGFKRPLHIRSGLWVGMDLFEQIVQVWTLFEHVLREQIVESNAQQLHLVGLLSDEAIVQTVANRLGIAADRAKRLAARIAGATRGLYTTKVIHNEDIRWGIRGMGPDMEAMKWRFPKGQPEIASLFEEIRKYDPAGHPGDRLVSLYLANAKMLGKGTPFRNMARSRSVNEVR